MNGNSIEENSNTVKKKEKAEIVRHDHNPFVENMVVPVKGQRVKLSRLGKDSNVDVVNHDTGEHYGTHVSAYRKVDAQQFVKLFTQNIAMTFGLKSAGIKALGVLIWALQSKAMEKDLIPLDKLVLDEFIKDHSDRKPPIKLSQPTFWRGLSELENAKIIAKHLRQGWYYINPNFAFNGDRIAFTSIIERKSKEEEAQQQLALEAEGDCQ
jgi:hypothetical protein